MLYLGIDIASKKHDCCIIGENSEVLAPVFTFENNADGFNVLLKNIRNHERDFSQVKIGLESTGHYGSNLISFLRAKGFDIVVFNPLQVDLYRKAGTLRKTKTDKADAKFIAQMLLTTENSSYTPVKPELAELKALIRHRSRIKAMRTRLKVSVSRLVDILFPELRGAVSSIHQASAYALLSEYPTVKAISDCHLTRLTNLLADSSRKHYGRDKAAQIKALADRSIGSNSCAVGFELQQTIRLITSVSVELKALDKQIKSLMREINSPILTIPGISYNLGSIILAEIGNIETFGSPSKLLAFAGLEPSTHQSGKFTGTKNSMVKRGSSYLRWAILQAARLISRYDPTFRDYAKKKSAEGKHYFVVQSHVGRKLIRVIFHMLKHNQIFVPMT
jgi:transposase